MPFNDDHIKGDVTVDEDQLWESFLNGDLRAWEQIFKLYYRDLYGYGLKLSTRPELVRDGIQELFVVLWDSRERLADVDSVKAYLLASLRRNLLKKLQKRRELYVDQQTVSGRIQFSPEEVIIRDEKRIAKMRALHEALELLPDRQKEVLYLKYYNGMSYNEIEKILSINYQSIRNHVYRAVKRLRKILDNNTSEHVEKA